jgi:hypothetical protein
MRWRRGVRSPGRALCGSTRERRGGKQAGGGVGDERMEFEDRDGVK